MKKTFLSVTVIVVAILGGLAHVGWAQLFGGGSSAEETAKILVHDDKFGMRGKEEAIKYGDRIIPLLEKESEDFKKLNGRNSFWIAEVLGSIDSELSRKTLTNLKQRKDHVATLVGSIGLCMLDAYPEQIDENSFLVRIVRQSEAQTETQLAIIALGHSGSAGALAPLHDLLSKRPNDYWHHAYACEALARLRSQKSVSILRECLQDGEFYALPEAYRAATCLGDSESTKLAIGRISNDLKGKNSGFLIDELERVTGKKHGYDKAKWEAWWASSGKDWKIPKRFLVPWDEQPEQY